MSFILQLKKIRFDKIDICEDCAYSIGKCISNNGELKLDTCEITKPAFERLYVALGDKHVRIS